MRFTISPNSFLPQCTRSRLGCGYWFKNWNPSCVCPANSIRNGCRGLDETKKECTMVMNCWWVWHWLLWSNFVKELKRPLPGTSRRVKTAKRFIIKNESGQANFPRDVWTEIEQYWHPYLDYSGFACLAKKITAPELPSCRLLMLEDKADDDFCSTNGPHISNGWVQWTIRRCTVYSP